MNKLFNKNLIVYCFTIIAFIIGTLLWGKIEFKYANPEEVVGYYSIFKYSPLNDNFRFILFISFVLLTYLLSFIYFNKIKINICKNSFILERNTNSQENISLIFLYALIIIQLIFFFSKDLNFNPIDLFHEGQALSGALNFKILNRLWSNSFVITSLFVDILNANIAWNLFEIQSLSSYRFFIEILNLICSLLILIFIFKFTNGINLNKNLKTVFYIFLVFLILILTSNNTFSYRDIPLFIFLIIVYEIFCQNKNLKLNSFFLGILPIISLLWSLDRGIFIIAGYIPLILILSINQKIRELLIIFTFLIISIISSSLALVNEKLKLQAPNTDTFTELGFNIYTKTQVINAPHNVSRTLFGNTIKFDESDSVVISAPVSTRFLGTTFDFIDDENLDNDTIFDNNATRFVDTWDNAGAVYMYDYLANYNGSIADPGAFVYAQNLNSQDQNYGFEPQYGTALDFTDNQVIIGTPNLSYGNLEGQVTLFQNSGTAKDWVLYRQSAPIVDINRIQNSQIYSAETNDTLINLDYMDPMQEKLLGVVRENIDYVNSVDPATYNSEIGGVNAGLTWGADQVGHIWFDTSKTRWINYHQNDVTYNGRFWGQVFPGSDVACYTWVKSTLAPAGYTGSGTPKTGTQYSVEAELDASNTVKPCYYYWVRNTDIVNTEIKALITLCAFM